MRLWKENIYPALLVSPVEITFLVDDLMGAKEISNGHIILDWQSELS